MIAVSGVEMRISAALFVVFVPFVRSQANDYLPLRNTFSSISKTPFYADKTELLRVFFEESNRPPEFPFFFVTCPRKFGKTINIDMVKHFAEIKFSDMTRQEAIDDFKHTKIGQYPKIMNEHINRYPVIHIELSGLGVGGLSPVHILREMATRLHDSLNLLTWTEDLEAYYKKHGTTYNEVYKTDELTYIEKIKSHNMTDEEMENFLCVVGKMLHEVFNETVIVLVDSYDHAALTFLHERSFQQTHMVYQIMNNMFNFAFRCPPERDHFKFALIVGVTSLSYSVEIALRSVSFHFPFLEEHPFTPFFGMTEEDVDQIFENYHCTKEEINAVKEFYAPYRTKVKRNIYNTYSISEYFKQRRNVDPSTLRFQFCTFWKAHEVQRGLVEFFKNPRFRERAARLIDKRKIPMYLYKTYSPRMLDEFIMLRLQGYRQPESDHADMYFTLMYEFGYLSYEDDAESTYCIPNADVQEVWEELYHMFTERVQN